MTVHLLTGFPGFLGRRLAGALLDRDEGIRLVALVEPRMLEPARRAAAELGDERIELLAGDITEERLGLEVTDHDRLTGEVGVVHHLAAIYDLGVPSELAQLVNVEGTGRVLDFCAACAELERLNYVSTAYVAGERTGVVYEHELALGQDFKNHYEATKFQAEVWVRERMDEIPTTIFRPAIVVGDSRTGETQKFDGPYYVLRFIATSREQNMPIANIGRGAAPFNVVPVDFVIDAMVELGEADDAVGETLHLCDPEPLGAREMVGLLSELYAGERPSFSVPSGAVAMALRVPALRRRFGGSPPEAIRYLNHPVRYDTRRAGELLAARGMSCPRFADYAPAMVDFFERNRDDPRLLGGA